MLKKILAFLLAISMLLATACGNSNSSDDSQTESSSSEQAIDSSSVDSSSGTETMSSSKSTSDSESSVSERETITETKASDDSSASDKTSTKATADVTNTTNTTKITSSTTSKSTTKSTTTTTKATTKQTTKATSSTSSSTTKPTGLTRLESSVWEMSFWNYDEKYLKIVREELIKYGQEFCKQRNAPKYQVNSKMYPYYDKNGKPLYAPCDKNGNVIAVGSKVEFPYDEHFVGSNYKTSDERLSGCRAFINGMYLYIERVICNSFRHGLEDMQWNITYGFEPAGICWTVMTGFPDDWK